MTGLSTTNDTIDASNVTVTTAKLVIDGASGNDTITGSAYDDFISGGVGTDTINGGDGSDTYVATTSQVGATVEGTGTGTSTGLVINLGSTAVTNTTILSATAQYTADSVTSVASGTVAYLFGSSASTNTAVVDTLVSIENVTGSTGIDYIIGSATANTITGGTGIDKLTGGLGVDSFVTVSGDAGQGASNTLSNWVDKNTIFGGVIAAGDTVTGAEVITDIAASDTLNLGNADLAASADLALIDDEYVIVQGTYVASTGVFTIGAGGNTGADSLVIYDSDSTAGFEWEFIVLQGVVTAEEGAVAAGVVTFA